MIKLSLKFDVSSSKLLLGIVGLSALAGTIYYLSSVGKVIPPSKFVDKTSVQETNKRKVSDLHEANTVEQNDKEVRGSSKSKNTLHPSNHSQQNQLKRSQSSQVFCANTNHKLITLENAQPMISSTISNSSESNNLKKDDNDHKPNHVCVKDEHHKDKRKHIEKDNVSSNVGDGRVNDVKIENNNSNLAENLPKDEGVCSNKNNELDRNSSDNRSAVREDGYNYQVEDVFAKDENQNDKSQHIKKGNVSSNEEDVTVKCVKAENKEGNLFGKLPENENLCFSTNDEPEINSSSNKSVEKVENVNREETQSNTKANDVISSSTDVNEAKSSDSKESESLDLSDVINDNLYECEVFMDHLTINNNKLEKAVECLSNVKGKKEKKLKEALNRVKLCLEAEDDEQVRLKDDLLNEYMQQLTTLRKEMWKDVDAVELKASETFKPFTLTIFKAFVKFIKLVKQSFKEAHSAFHIIDNLGRDNSSVKFKIKLKDIKNSFKESFDKLDEIKHWCETATFKDVIKKTQDIGKLVLNKIVDCLDGCYNEATNY